MWCSTCQQDVPQLGSPSGDDARCAKCGTILHANSQAGVTNDLAGNRASAAAATNAETIALEKVLRMPPLAEEDWALEAELRGVQRLLKSLQSRKSTEAEPLSLHFPHEPLPSWHIEQEQPEEDDSVAAPPIESPRRGHPAAWTILSVGLAVFACGAVLLTWSLVGKREDLWPIGLPLALFGQAGLILGVVLQLESVVGGIYPPSHAPAPKAPSRDHRSMGRH